MRVLQSISEARTYLDSGGILAYPTEAVYGLGCDPWNTCALEKLLEIKHRPSSKGLIVLIAEWSQLFDLIGDVSTSCLDRARSTWPGPVTWVFPKSAKVPALLSGDYNTIAVRMPAHKLAHELCFAGPVVSTSANRTGATPARSIEELHTQFSGQLEFVLAGELGTASAPSAIYDVQTGLRLR